ncbi:MAG: thiamine-monophosphate kinase [Acidobacteriota bacterium]
MSSPGSLQQQRVSDVGERALIERIRARVPPPPAALVISIGDDAAVAVPDRGALQVLTTDALVEGIHFDRRFSSAVDIGYKALAVNVSDVASMGGTPRLALLSLMLPPALPLSDIDGLLEGLLLMAGECGVALAGGNITRSPGPLVIDVTAIGSVKPRKILTRGGGRPGDALYITGQIGAAAAGLEWLRTGAAEMDRLGSWRDSQSEGARVAAPDDAQMAECVARHCRPVPRVRLGALLGRNRAASACMDLSDGLADAVTQMAGAGGTGATLDAAVVPVHPGAAAWFGAAGRDPLIAALAGGDDYELLFAVPRRSRGRLRSVIREARGVQVTWIGELTSGGAVALSRGTVSEPLPGGFTHF